MGAVAAAVPDLEPFIALVGAVFFSTLGKLDMIFEFFFFLFLTFCFSLFTGLLVPCVVEAIYLYPNNYGPLKWKLYKNVFLSVFAIFALIAGSTVSIGHIIDIYK
jgi:solute carrier family 36 (proton-coupled amino acid transporter)